MTQNLGSTSNPLSMTGEQWVLEERTDDPLSPEPGECWIRSDLNAGDKIATLKFGDGSEVPIFPTGTSEPGVLEVRRVQTGGQTGYLPVAEPDESRFPQFRLQHNNTVYGLHNDISPATIPDSGMFQSPIYQWWGAEIDAADGTSPVDWPESLAGLADATAVGGPSKQTQDGFEAAQYDGADDGHDWTSDSQIPTGDNAYTIAALVYVSSVKDHEVTGYGNATDSEACRLAVTDENGDLKVRGANWVNDLTGATTVSTGQWHTIGHSYDGGSIREVFLDGARDAADDPGTLNIQDQNHTIGYRLDGAAGWYVDGFVAEILYASAYNGEQAFGDYHQDRLG